MIDGAKDIMPAILRILTAGGIVGIIAMGKFSKVNEYTISGLNKMSGVAILLIGTGILMSAVTASTTSGTAVASSVFGQTILSLGVPALSGAAMIHAGSTVLDHLPQGSFFHATGGSVFLSMKERLKLIPYESLVGLTLIIVSTIIYGVIL